MKIIVVNGKGGSGKDTLENYFTEFAEMCKNKVNKTSMVEGVKDIAKICGWTGGKDDKDRKFLSDLKDLLEDYSDLPFEDVLNKILRSERDNYDYIFIDAREPKDIDRIKEIGLNCYTVLITREETNREYNNHADDGVFDYNYNFKIENNGSLEDLRTKARELFEEIDSSFEFVPLEEE